MHRWAPGSRRIYLICHPCKFTKITPGAIFIYPSEVCSQRVDGPLEPERDLDRARPTVVSQVAYPRPEQINHQIKCSVVEDTIKIRQGKGGRRAPPGRWDSWAQSKRFHGSLFLDTLCSAWNKHLRIYICCCSIESFSLQTNRDASARPCACQVTCVIPRQGCSLFEKLICFCPKHSTSWLVNIYLNQLKQEHLEKMEFNQNIKFFSINKNVQLLK